MTKILPALVLASCLVACAHGVSDTDGAPAAVGTLGSLVPGSLAKRTPTTATPIAPVQQDALYVLMREQRSVQLLDVDTGDWLATIRFDSDVEPESMTANRDGTKLAISFPGDGGALLVIETATGKTLASRRLPAANGNAQFSPDGTQIWTAQDDGVVLVLDATTLAVVDRVVVGKRPSHVAFAGKQVWVSNEGGGDVTGIDASTHAVIGTVLVEPGPRAIWPGADGLLYVDCATALSVVDPVKLSSPHHMAMGATPGRAIATENGNVWVTSGDGHVVVFDERGLELTRFPAEPGASDLVFTPGSARGYVTNERAGSITFFDAPTRVVTATVPIGDRPAAAMFWSYRTPLSTGTNQIAFPITE